VDELREIAGSFGLVLSDEDLSSFRNLIVPTLAALSAVERLVEPAPLAPRYPRLGGYRPGPEENPHNAWAWRAEIKGAPDGPLAGRTVAVKDNVCVAGLPMANGSAALEGYVPEIDATIVTRTLDAGATILGKAACEDMCFDGGSHSPVSGPIENPRYPGRTTGGSSSGSGALVASGAVDLAIGGDQAGSIRIPAAWCGIVGHKPTYGLVPYTGAIPIELTLDHAGPMGRTVRDVALFLEVLAGRDGLDPRQPTEVPTEPYSRLLDGKLDGVRIGVVTEGFDWDGFAHTEVDDAVRDATQRLAKGGAEVTGVSIPLHRQGSNIWMAIGLSGATELMVKGHGMGTNWKGYYVNSAFEALGKGLRTRINDISDTVKMTMLIGEYVNRQYGHRHYGKGQNLAFALREAYDAALADVDVLVMPTVPILPSLIVPPEASREERVVRGLEMLTNTAPFDVTGHPAVSVPCQPDGELPVGLMIIGRHFADATVLRVADAFEQLVGGFGASPMRRGGV
jgi:amidase